MLFTLPYVDNTTIVLLGLVATCAAVELVIVGAAMAGFW
jgi:hypothetical protein